MTPEQFRRAKDLFIELCDKSPSEQEAILRHCSGDSPEVLEKVRQMLGADEPILNATLDESLLLRAEPSTIPGTPPSDLFAQRYGNIAHYRLLEPLGQGGQGAVYLAEDTRLGRRVALKTLLPSFARLPEARHRFLREAELASKLSHPGICTVYDVGEQDGVLYIVMELVPGRTLAYLISTGRLWGAPPNTSGAARELAWRTDDSSPNTKRRRLHAVIRFIESACRALAFAHEQNLIHRDIKPANIMVTAHGSRPVILDFGLARVLNSERELTATGQVMGTPLYMSPEQLDGRELDRRTDVYSMGVTLYECLTGHLPFEAATQQELFERIRSAEPIDPRKFNPLISSDLRVVLESALQKEPVRRYKSAQDLADDLRRVRERRPIQAKRISLAGRVTRWAQRRPVTAMLVVVAAGSALTISALGGYLAVQYPNILAERKIRREQQIIDAVENGYLGLGIADYRLAVESFTGALTLRADQPEAVAGLALAFSAAGHHDRALEFLDANEEAIRTHPELHRVRAAVLRSARRLQEAADVLESLGLPRTALGHFLSAEAYVDEGHEGNSSTFELAGRSIDRAILAMKNVPALYHYERMHILGHVVAESRGLESEVNSEVQGRLHGRRNTDVPHDQVLSTPERIEARAARLIPADLRTTIEDHCRTLTTLWPESARSWFWCGFVMKYVDPRRSIEAFERALALDPKFENAHTNLVEVLRVVEGGHRAVTAARRLVAALPESAQARMTLATQLIAKGDLDEALANAAECCRIESRTAAHWTLKAAIYRKMGDTDAARESLERAIGEATQPDRIQLKTLLSAAFEYHWIGDHDRALATVERAIAVRPQQPMPYVVKGVLIMDGAPVEVDRFSFGDTAHAPGGLLDYLTLKRRLPDVSEDLHTPEQLAVALDAAKTAFDLAPRLADELLVRVLEAQKETEEAVRVIRKAIRDAGTVSRTIRFVLLLAELGRAEEAQEELETLLQREPDDLRVWFAVARVANHQNKIPEALAAYREVLERDPENERAHDFLTGLLQSLDPAAYRAELERWVKLHPEDPAALERLAAEYLRSRFRRKEAFEQKGFELAERAAELTGRSEPRVLETLARGHYVRGEYDLAVKTLTDCIRLSKATEAKSDSLRYLEGVLASYREKAAGSK